MIEVADVFRRFAADYLSAHGASMLPSHRRAIEDILDCRTAALGGQVWRCEACNTEVFSFHSCGNRSCPKCHTAQTQEWLEHRQAEMLPVPYFHITVTVPAELREVLRANQRDGYAVLMQASAAAIIELARDPRYVGGTVAVLAVLHTWTQQLNLHPHVHCLVSGGGISEDGKHLASGTPEVPGTHQGSRQVGARQVPGVAAAKAPRPRHPRRGVAHALDPPRHRLGQRRAGRARIPRPLRLSHRSHQRPHRWSRRRNGHHPIQGPQDRPPANLPPQRRGIHAPLPPARAAARLPQGPLFRPVASRAAPQRRSGAADAATAGATQGSIRRRSPSFRHFRRPTRSRRRRSSR